jgi:hypothetical protein
MYTPKTLLHADDAGDFDPGANLMELQPDPKSFAVYVKSINRPDIASELFVRLLEGYQTSRSDVKGDPLRCAGVSFSHALTNTERQYTTISTAHSATPSSNPSGLRAVRYPEEA